MTAKEKEQGAVASTPSLGLASNSIVPLGQAANLPSCSEILGWVPPSPDFIIGNQDVKAHLRGLLANKTNPEPTCFIGGTGTGKTASVFAVVQPLLCPIATAPDWMACQKCHSCRALNLSTDCADFAFHSTDSTVSYWRLDCTSVTKENLSDLRGNLEDVLGQKIVYLDEAHRLNRDGLEKLVLEIIERQRSDVVWLASTADDGGLTPRFRKTFKLMKTAQPSEKELAKFVAARCKDFKIEVDRKSLQRIAQGIANTPSLALTILAEASLSPSRRITADLVDEVLRHHAP